MTRRIAQVLVTHLPLQKKQNQVLKKGKEEKPVNQPKMLL